MSDHIVFGGAEGGTREFNSARIVVLPVPYDKTSTWIKGADKGPFAILEASRALEFFDIETDTEVHKEGIFTCDPLPEASSPEEMVRLVTERVSGFIDNGKFVVLLGGEHSVSIGAVEAFSSRVCDLSVLQLDAHTDLRDKYEGSKFNHGCVMARVKEKCPFVQVGIRSMDLTEKEKVQEEGSVPCPRYRYR